MDSNEDILQKIYLFAKFSPNEISRIASKVKHVVLNQRDVLFSAGNTASSFFVVRYGTLNIVTNTKDGDDVNLTSLSAGDHFGELPFLDGEKRSASVEAIEKSELLEISYDDLQSVLSSSLEMEKKFYKAISSYLVKRMRLLTTDLTYARELKKRYT